MLLLVVCFHKDETRLLNYSIDVENVKKLSKVN
jgi:hypothetical protein